MATKSKKSRFNNGCKALAWVLCIVSMCAISVFAPLLANINMDTAAANYAQSTECSAELESYSLLVGSAYYTPTESQIKATVDSKIDGLKVKRDAEIDAVKNIGGTSETAAYESYTEDVTGIVQSAIDGVVSEVVPEYGAEQAAGAKAADSAGTASPVTASPGEDADAISQYKQNRIDEINKAYSEKISTMEQQVRDGYESARAEAKRKLDATTGMYYVIYDIADLTQPLGTNLSNDALVVISSQQAKRMDILTNNSDSSTNMSQTSISSGFSPDEFIGIAESFSGDMVFGPEVALDETGQAIAVAISPELYGVRDADYFSTYKLFGQYVIWLIVCIAIFVAAFVWIMYTAGRNPHNDEIKIGYGDVIYLDVGFLLLLIVIPVCMMLYLMVGQNNAKFSGGTFSIDPLGGFGLFGSVTGGVCALLIWSSSLSRRTKNGTAREFTLTHHVFGGAKTAYDNSTLTFKDVSGYIAYIVSGIIIFSTMTFGGFLGVFAGIILLIIHVVCTMVFLILRGAGVRKIERGVAEIKNGNTEYVITPTGNTNLDKIVSGVNNIAEGLSAAVQREVKAERMRTELITNISHDLKTPLTSILTYVDLLKKESGLSEEAHKYLEVLDVKSHRLKALTDDLFEAAKAQSGDINVELTRIELVQFMAQALGELSDRIEQSGLTFVTELPQEEKIHVMADGKLLFRVVGNIVDNAIKYSIPGSRVYFDIALGSGRVCITFKNLSKDELNITEDELIERFVRGDSSRNTEGSGLGLAIAKNFMQLMNGEFVIEIDGDLFKAKLYMNIVA